VLGSLLSSNRSNQIGAMGELTSAVDIAQQFPKATLVFGERTQIDPRGIARRIIDVTAYEVEVRTVAGQQVTVEVMRTRFEIKEVSTADLGTRAPHQLALDISADSADRAVRPAPIAGSRPFFETFRWRIRRIDLERIARQRLAPADRTDPVKVEAAMRDLVRDSLRPAFDDLAFKALPQAEQEGYRNAFEHDLRLFVDFF
jgi:hypothetical protein